MNDVVTAASRGRVLVTGFGPFPGAPTNPTLDMLRQLAAKGVEGVDLVFTQLPVTFTGVGPALREAARCRPDAILMLGLARTRQILNVETLARNVAGRATPDTDGALPTNTTLVEGGPATREATWPAAAILASLQRAGHVATLSDDAGDYVCNAALYYALHERLARLVGFLHVPPTGDRSCSDTEALASAARVIVEELVPAAATRRRAARPA